MITVGWEPPRAIAIYNPGGPEQELQGLPDFRQLEPGENSAWSRG